MYAYIKGTVVGKGINSLVLETAGGIGYELKVVRSVLERAVENEKIQVFTYLKVREDAHELYGFASEDEKRLFLLLVGVSDVGPSTALGILSAMTLEALIQTISEGDHKALQAVKGIGQKTAQKIVLELKDKLPKEGFDLASVSSSTLVAGISKEVREETLAALMALGMNKIAADRSMKAAIKNAPQEQNLNDVETLLKLALNHR
jgi:holliday junction DNA helicase RuvA